MDTPRRRASDKEPEDPTLAYLASVISRLERLSDHLEEHVSQSNSLKEGPHVVPRSRP